MGYSLLGFTPSEAFYQTVITIATVGFEEVHQLDNISCENLSANLAGKSIKDLEKANNTGANIIGLKRKDKSYMINPPKKTRLSDSDRLFALGTREQIDQLIECITTNP